MNDDKNVNNNYDFEALKKPFSEQDITWRIGRAGLKKDGSIWATCFAYITNRAIMNRLDDVIGCGNWKNEYHKGVDGGVMCGLSIKIDGEWVTKYDGAENTDFESIKGGLSGAMKRSAVMWGMGRYLYSIDEGFVIVDKNGENYQSFQKGKNGKPDIPAFKWNPPKLPAWALPENEPEKKDPPKVEPTKPKGNLEKFLEDLALSTSLEDLKLRFIENVKFSWLEEEVQAIADEKDRLKKEIQESAK